MPSTRITPFPLHGLVPYRGALYSVTHQEVFSQGRVYRIGRYVGERYDERVLINHWVLLENMENLARYQVGDTALHAIYGEVAVVKRCWRFSEGRIVYHIRTATESATQGLSYQEQLSACVPSNATLPVPAVR